MKMLLTAIALILTMTAAASATETPTGSTVLGGGPLYDGAQNSLYCFYINVGAASITPTAQEIFKQSSTTPIASTTSCANGTAIAPNQSCILYSTSSLDGGYPYACKLTFSTVARGVRGAVQLLDINFRELAT